MSPSWPAGVLQTLARIGLRRARERLLPVTATALADAFQDACKTLDERLGVGVGDYLSTTIGTRDELAEMARAMVDASLLGVADELVGLILEHAAADVSADLWGIDPRAYLTVLCDELTAAVAERARRHDDPLANWYQVETAHTLVERTTRLELGLGRLSVDISRTMIGAVGAADPSVQRPNPGNPGLMVGIPDRNPLFVGRVDELSLLSASLESAGPATVLIGLGGVGKSALATEFCFRHRNYYDSIRWLSADNRDALVASYVSIAPALGLSVDGLTEVEAIARVRSWFESCDEPWLLVFDNCDDPTVLAGVIPQSPRGRVLVTSRYRDWRPHNGYRMPIESLTPATGVQLLEARIGAFDDRDALALAEHLGGLPLALEQAAAFLAATAWSCGRYLQALRERGADIHRTNPARVRRLRTNEDVTLLTVWDQSIEIAERESPGAANLLGVLAHLAPDAVPRPLLSQPFAAGEPMLTDGDDLLVDGAIGALSRYSLIRTFNRPETGEISGCIVHRLIQSITRIGQDDADIPTAWADTALRVVARAFPSSAQIDPSWWPRCVLLGPHVAALSGTTVSSGARRVLADLLLRYSAYLLAAGTASSGIVYAMAAEGVAIDADEAMLELEAQRLQAVCSVAVGDVARGVASLSALVPRAEALVGSTHPWALTTLTALGEALRESGQYRRSADIQRDVVRRYENAFGREETDLASARNNLALSLFYCGEYDQAILLQEHVYEARKATFGEGHPATLTAMANLAMSAWALDDFDRALDLEKDVLAGRLQSFGENHPSTLTARHNLALTMRHFEPRSEARAMLEQAVEGRSRFLGEDHPDSMASRAKLAAWIHDDGNAVHSVAILEPLLEKRVRLSGWEHPETLSDANSLALALEDVGRPDEARLLLMDVVRRMKATLGAHHPQTLSCSHSLGRMQQDQNQLADARLTAAELLDGCRATRGDRHWRTTRAALLLASVLAAQGERKLAGSVTRRDLMWMISASNAGLHPEQVLMKRSLLEARHAPSP